MNENQLKAVKNIDGQLAMVACPGSGKTTTLLNRIHYMTSEMQIPPESILMVTFSKAAADEMKNRYRRDYVEDSKVYFGTIHSFCRAVIKKFQPNLFQDVISDFEKNDFFMKRLRNAQNIGNKKDFIDDLMLDISKFKNSNTGLSSYSPSSCKNKEMFAKLYNAYEEYKRSIKSMDFDDMLIIAYDILCHDEYALDWVQNQYQYVMVDEYQDINELQKDIIYQIVGKRGNLAVVGDDDQSIYGFRGAKTSIMLNFQKDYFKKIG